VESDLQVEKVRMEMEGEIKSRNIEMDQKISIINKLKVSFVHNNYSFFL